MANSAPKTLASITLPPLTPDVTPDALPWAIDGTLVTPTDANETNGWVPAIPPDNRLANHLAYLQSQWNERLSATGFFAQRATRLITMIGTPSAGDTLTLTYDSVSFAYVVAPGDTLATIPDKWAQQFRTSSLRNVISASSDTGGTLMVSYRDPGTIWPAGVPTLVATGGLSASTIADLYGGSAGRLSVTSALAGGESELCDLLHGSFDPEGVAVKLQFRKGTKLGAFTAGNFTGTQADLANIGASSVRMGKDCTASGAQSVAIGSSCTATATACIAIGANSNATSLGALALGEVCTASENYALAAGYNNTASATGAVALGSSNTASGAASMAVGLSNVAATDHSVALGNRSVTSNPNEVALASGDFTTPGDCQRSMLDVRAEVTNTTGELTPGSGSHALILQNSSVYKIHIEGRALWQSGSDGATGDRATWAIDVSLYVDGAGAVTLDAGWNQEKVVADYVGVDLTGGSAWNAAPASSSGTGAHYSLVIGTATNALTITGKVNNLGAAALTARFGAFITAAKVSV